MLVQLCHYVRDMVRSHPSPVSNRLPFTLSRCSTSIDISRLPPSDSPDHLLALISTLHSKSQNNTIHSGIVKMCCGCWPFADVWLEDPPKAKKKEEKKEEEKTEWVLVPEGAAFYPVSHMLLGYTHLAPTA